MNAIPVRTRLAHALTLALAATTLTACGGGRAVRSNPPAIAPATTPPTPSSSTNTPPASGTLTIANVYDHWVGDIPEDIRVAATGQLWIDTCCGYLGNATIGGSVVNEGLVAAYGGGLGGGTHHAPIGGNYLQGNTGTLSVSVGQWVTGLHIEGNATLDGTLRVFATPGPYPTANILQANGAITGQFANVILSSVFLSGTVNYGVHDITLDLTPVAAKIVAGSAANAVTLAGASNLDSIIGSAGWSGASATAAPSQAQQRLHASLNALWHIGDAAQAARSFDSLSGQAYAGTRALLLDSGDARRLRAGLQLRQPGDATGTWLLNRSATDLRADAGAMGVQLRTEGMQAGIDHWFDKRVLVGMAAGHEQARAYFARGDDQAQWRLPSATVYAQYRHGPWHVTGIVEQSRATLAMQRWVELGAGDRHRVTSALALDRFGAAIEAGRELRIGNSRLTPYGALTHTAVRSEAFVEHGDTGFELTARPAMLTRSSAELGLRYASDRRWDGDGWMRLSVDAGLSRRLEDADPWQAAYVGLPDLRIDLPDAADGRDRQHLHLQAEFGRTRQRGWNAFLLGRWNRNGIKRDLGWQIGAQLHF